MNREILSLHRFDAEIKRLYKKFKSLKGELAGLATELIENPKMGENLGAGLYKIRLASKSKGGGKSGGFRVITYYIETKNDIETVYLVSIYNKSEFSSISKNELLKVINEELE